MNVITASGTTVNVILRSNFTEQCIGSKLFECTLALDRCSSQDGGGGGISLIPRLSCVSLATGS